MLSDLRLETGRGYSPTTYGDGMDSSDNTAAQGQDVPTNCPFCGADGREEWQAEFLHDAHDQIEALALADRGSEEFDRLLASVASFVGVERV